MLAAPSIEPWLPAGILLPPFPTVPFGWHSSLPPGALGARTVHTSALQGIPAACVRDRRTANTQRDYDSPSAGGPVVHSCGSGAPPLSPSPRFLGMPMLLPSPGASSLVLDPPCVPPHTADALFPLA
ncbi:unnamed protein product [Closterium sp. NIES-54]